MKIEKEKFKISAKVILRNCIYTIFIICILYNLIFFINTTILKNDYLKIFGISFFNMKNDLMQEDINKNDLVIVKEVSEKDLQEGDIIAYTINENTRINKIINKKDCYTTKSNKNYYPDIEKITYNQIIGKVVMCVPFFGIVIGILQSLITSIFVFVFLILKFWYNRYIYIKAKERARKKKKFFK